MNSQRIEAIDWARGLAMVLMALDHSLAFVGCHLKLEGLYGYHPEYPTMIHFLTRFITHYAPTTFIFLAGASVVLAADHRKKRMESEAEISSFFIERGLILMLTEFTILNYVWNWGAPYHFGVISLIGSLIVILSILRFVRPLGLCMIASFLLVVVNFVLKELPFVTTGKENFISEILLYADFEYGRLFVSYPILPWIGVGLLGCAFGKIVLDRQEQAFRLLGKVGVFALTLFIIIRYINKFGNLLPREEGFIDFLITSKYPPDVCFLLWTLGGMAVSLFMLNYFRKSNFLKSFPCKVIKLFGQVAFFFYISHLVIYKGLSRLIGFPSKLGFGYLLFIIGLAILFPMCNVYLNFKQKHPRFLHYF